MTKSRKPRSKKPHARSRQSRSRRREDEKYKISALRALDRVVAQVARPSVSDSEENKGQVSSVLAQAGGREYTNILSDVITLEDSEGSILHGTCVNVQALLKQCNFINENLYPAEQYVKDQISLFLLSILGEVKVRNFTCGLLREGIENIYHMATCLYNVEPRIASLAISDLCGIILILECILNHAEVIAGVGEVNYAKVREFITALYPESVSDDRSLYYGKARYFRIEKLLGAGGFGAVFQAYVGGVECAMKHVPLRLLPDPENATVDKKVASLINHMCLVNYYACFCTQESYVTVMEFIRGVDVNQLLIKCGKLPSELVRIVLAQLGLALQHMHYKGFIHRDVKPANLMISKGCRVKLFDFDTAKVCYGKHHQKYMYYFSKKTTGEFKDGEIAGTMGYMAPEVFRKESYGRAADWYSVGLTAFELAVGKLPYRFDGRSFKTQAEIVQQTRLSWPREHKDYVLQAFVDYCMRSKKHRLCTKRYLEFLYHPYFEHVEWEHVENGVSLMEFEPLDQLIASSFEESSAATRVNGNGTEFAESENDLLKRVELLFGSTHPEFHETSEQKPMFVYSAPEFRRLIETLRRKGANPVESLYRVPEHVFTTETPEPYEFEGV